MPLPQGSAVLKQLFTLFAEADEASGLCGNEVFVFLFFSTCATGRCSPAILVRTFVLAENRKKKELKGSLAD